MGKQYAERDIEQLDKAGGYYIRHVSAMTKEQLHTKSDIAAELAWRDHQMAALAAQLDEARQQHGATINRLYELFNVDDSDGEVRAKWALLAAETCKNERDALAAQVEALRQELCSVSDWFSAYWPDLTPEQKERLRQSDKIAKATPQCHLRELRAEAVLDAVNEHAKKYGNSHFGRHLREYADQVRRGEV